MYITYVYVYIHIYVLYVYVYLYLYHIRIIIYMQTCNWLMMVHDGVAVRSDDPNASWLKP